MSLEESLTEFLEDGDDWERKKTSVDGVFTLKLPEYKGNPPRLAVELNPTDSSGKPTKKRGLMIFNMGELEDFREMINEERLDGLMENIMEVNPEKGKKKRPEEEKEDIIEI
ncbi:hypothetical protein AKJ37_06330 [candidate division MSBL1 archaeon SCGC-AAA259I09]|uniref:Uncharacterized protein n=3 Tax=candidate division MSBL1 TaxID=215777 RepID=A0A133UPF6_9EURY|nr:hypothetical protein AKJ37_06330 [candidate division MSBL1 archaeon SCGC-AAA259I09]KXA96994.1 hypothetical protein AKJ39_03835 [candidate division MSBL1 archaeon SCGC-AAA259J03]KXA99520.1 hypothetical protein AKJ40_02955 [candidate division MSBL1 archaeon SCGC-AAA259M10]